MIRLNQAVIVSALSLLALVGCGGNEQSTAPSSPASSASVTDKVGDAAKAVKDKTTETAGAMKDKAAETAAEASKTAGEMKDKATGAVAEVGQKASDMKDKAATAIGTATGMSELTGLVSSMTTAIKAGDFAKAQAEFGKFEGTWAKVEDAIKTKSPQAYAAIADQAAAVKSALNAQDKDKAMTALKELSTGLAGAPQS